ncbi:MAG: hypothetical protein KDI50_00535 [Candidatus Competibacteraceae bacterium]|nr:hypothetical protein [Candidatus Competibacteraceae bacterium]
MTKIHILADDLTGALDSVAEVPVMAPVHAGTQRYPVEALITGLRDIRRDDLPDRLNSIMPWFEKADFCIKKVDSLLRGNTFDEVAWVARAGRFRQIVFTPAFPKLGRVTFDLHHWLSTSTDASNSTALTPIDNPSLQTKQALGKPHCVEGGDSEQLQQALMQDTPSNTLSMFDLSPTVRLTADAASALRSAQISTLIHKLPKPGALFVIGGDTFLDIVQASGANTIVAGPSVRAGWGYARLQGGLWDGVICHSRSGAFGDDDDLVAMVRIVNCATTLI